MKMHRNTGQQSLDRFIPALAFILIFGMAARAPLDSDLWWHLRAGQASLELGRPLLVDFFSHTRFAEAWTNHSWLAQIVLFAVFYLGGHLALGALVSVLAAASLLLVYAQMEGHPILRAFILVLAATVAAPVWSPRPQLFSLLCFAILGYILYQNRKTGRGRLWLLVPLFILWSNLHGGYVLGMLLIAATAGGLVFDRFFPSPGTPRLPWKRIGQLLLWGALGGLAVAANPNGPSMWAIPFRTVGVGVLRELISEWASPDFHEITQQPFLWLLFLALGSAALSRRRIAGPDLFALLGFAYLGFLARRNFGPFALVAAPALSRHLPEVLSSMADRLAAWSGRQGEAWRRGPLQVSRLQVSPGLQAGLNLAILALMAGAALLKLLVVTSPGLLSFQTSVLFPLAAAQWIEKNHPAGEIFNDYSWGGYLGWTLRGYPVFVDGRTDLYDDGLLRSYLTAARGEPGWEEVLDEHRVNLVLVPTGGGLSRALANSPGWRLGYQDETAVVYLRREVIPP